MIKLGEWSEEQQDALQKELKEQVKQAGKEAEANGTLGQGPQLSAKYMFEDVYKDMPWHLREQRQELGV